MDLKVLIPSLLLFAIAYGQSSVFTNYDWRTPSRIQEWPNTNSHQSFEQHSVIPNSYSSDEMAKHYSDNSPIYNDGSFSAEFEKIPYMEHGAIDHSIPTSFENYGRPREEELNMTTARIGGFAGSGDTKGFGAYDFPKNHHPETVPIPPRPPRVSQPALEDLLRIGREHHSGYPDPDTMLLHPIPPPS